MARPYRFRSIAGIVVLAVLGLYLPGCQPASRYKSLPPTAPAKTEIPQPEPKQQTQEIPVSIPPEIGWLPDRGSIPSVPIQIIHPDSNPEKWNELARASEGKTQEPRRVLKRITPWLFEPLARAASTFALHKQPAILRIPTGLPDPSPYIPPENPLTVSRWELGRRLFFDRSWLTAQGQTSCATCHKPEFGFADPVRHHGQFNTPSLLNCVYNTTQFWNGRARFLEEVVQRKLDDERDQPVDAPFQHVWGGVVGRLLMSESYREQFFSVFGSGPTQNNLGKALATYLRTLYSGDSIYDQAIVIMKTRGSNQLEPADFQGLLTPQRLAELYRPGQEPRVVAEELFKGYELFHDRFPGRPLHCSGCHSGALTTDNRFHNVGIGYDPTTKPYPGHMGFVPIGQRSREVNGAFRTPSLRESTRSAPYFHNGQAGLLAECLEQHANPAEWNAFLDPRIPIKNYKEKVDTEPLILFINALKGRPIDSNQQVPLELIIP